MPTEPRIYSIWPATEDDLDELFAIHRAALGEYGCIWLEDIEIDPEYQGKGIGTTIIQDLVAKHLSATTSMEAPDGSLRIERHEIFDDWSRIRNEWILIKEGRTKVFKFHHTIYSGQELKDRLYQVGFKSVKLFGDLDGNEYGA